MPSPSKSKGNSFERELAAHLSVVFAAPFLRVPSSGAFTGGKNKVRMDAITEQQRRVMSGDLIPPETLGTLKIECKSYKSIPWHQIVEGNCKQLDKWLEQARDDKCLWFLAFKITRQGTYICTSQSFFRPYDKGVFDNGLSLPPSYAAYSGHYIVPIEDFFTTNQISIKGLCEHIKVHAT